MKRVISLFLAMAMILSLGICGAYADGEELYAVEGEELVLFDTDEYKLTLTGNWELNENMKGDKRLDLSAVLENRTENPIGMSYSGTVNGWSITNLQLADELQPNAKAKTHLWFFVKDVEADSYDDLQEMHLSFSVVNKTTDLVNNDPVAECSVYFNGAAPEAASAKAEEPEEPEVEFEPVTTGDTISLDFVEIEVGNIEYGDKLSETSNGVTYSFAPTTDGNVLFWLGVTLKNLNSTAYDIGGWKTKAQIVFDDEYTYEGEMRNIVGGNAKAMEPLVENRIYVCAEVPRSVAEAYESVAVQFGFKENFAQYDPFNDSLETMDYRYEFTPDDEEQAESTDANIPIAIGDTITTDEYEFTLNNVELTYALLPPNTSGFYYSYSAPQGKVYLHVDASIKNLMKRDIRIDELFSVGAVYSDGYEYNGSVVVNNGDANFDWVSSYVAATPLETCHAHGLVECPVEVDQLTDYLCATMKLSDGTVYEYVLRP